MSVVVSFRIDRRTKEKMDELKHVNWSEIVRKAILETIKKEEEKKRSKNIDRIRRAVIKSEELSRKAKGWNSVEEIRKWRER